MLLSQMKITDLKVLAKERGIEPQGDKRRKSTWLNAIENASSCSRTENKTPPKTTQTDRGPNKTVTPKNLFREEEHLERARILPARADDDGEYRGYQKNGEAGKYELKDCSRQGCIKDSKTNGRIATVMFIFLEEEKICGSGTLVKYLVGGKLHNCLLTNHHILQSPEVAKKAIGFFHVEKGKEASVRVKFNPTKFFKTSKELDFTLVAFADGRNGNGKPAVQLERQKVVAKDKIVLIQHPEGGTKKISTGMVLETSKTKLRYECATSDGSSGSAVYDDEWNFIGLHYCSIKGKKVKVGILVNTLLDFLDGKKIDYEVNGDEEHEECFALAPNVFRPLFNLVAGALGYS